MLASKPTKSTLSVLSKSYYGPPVMERTSLNASPIAWNGSNAQAQALLIQQVFRNVWSEHHEIRSWLAIRVALDEWAACSHQVDASARSLDGPAPARKPVGRACPSASLAFQAIPPALKKQACERKKSVISTDNKLQKYKYMVLAVFSIKNPTFSPDYFKL